MISPVSLAFKRGATFSFMVQLPSLVEAGQLADWTPTCQIRRRELNDEDALLAEPAASFVDETAQVIRVFHANTKGWPIGLVEMDIRITSPIGEVIYTTTVTFDIQREITYG